MTKTVQRFSILFLLITFSCTTLNAQLLNNTRWRSFNSQNVFDIFWNFNNDTVAFSPDNFTWFYKSVYTEVGNVIAFRDIENSQCDSAQTGVYHFSVQQDTLLFSVVSESCSQRLDYFTSHYFVDFPIGIHELDVARNASIYPVPFSHELNIKTESGEFDFILLDITGRKLTGNSFTASMHLNTENLEVGMYIYELRNEGRVVKSGTLIKD